MLITFHIGSVYEMKCAQILFIFMEQSFLMDMLICKLVDVKELLYPCKG